MTDEAQDYQGDKLVAAMERLAKPTKSTTSDALGDRQVGNVNLIEANVKDKIKETRMQLDKLEAAVTECAEHVRDKMDDLTEIANTTLNATASLKETINGMLTHELKSP